MRRAIPRVMLPIAPGLSGLSGLSGLATAEPASGYTLTAGTGTFTLSGQDVTTTVGETGGTPGSVGPQSPTAATTTGSTTIWTAAVSLIEAVGTSGGNYATSAIPAGSSSRLIVATGFDFSAIPSGATITGIVAEVNKATGSGTGLRDLSIRLCKASVAVGDNKADTATNWGTMAYKAYGSSADLWGTTWTVAEIQDSGFGLTVSANNVQAKLQRSARVDHIRITVHYTA